MTQPTTRRLVTEDRFLVTDANATAAYNAVNSIASLSPNYIINGAFDIWQRGTSTSVAPGATNIFIADRWSSFNNVSGSTVTVSQQAFTPGTAPVSGYEGKYFLRFAMSGYTSSYLFNSQKIEDVRTLAGQTATLSFWAKSSVAMSVPLDYVQNFGSGGSTLVNNSIATASVTTSWQRFSYTFNVPSVSGKTISSGTDSNLELRILLGANGSLDVWGVQLEKGSVATAFRRNANSIQGELAACQRYYYRVNASSTDTNYYRPTTGVASSTGGLFLFNFPVTMRIAPYSIDSSAIGTWKIFQNNSTYTGTSLLSLGQNGLNASTVSMTATGQTSGQFCILEAAGSQAGYVGFSAEL